MCRLDTCPICLGRTWIGCGQHADAVLQDVALASRCVASSERGVERFGPDALLNTACIRVKSASGSGAVSGASPSDSMLEEWLNTNRCDASNQGHVDKLIELPSLASRLQMSIGVVHVNAQIGSPLHWHHPNPSTSAPATAACRSYLLSTAAHIVSLQHFDGRLTFADASEWPALDAMVTRLAHALRLTASRPQVWWRCSQGDNFGCGAVFRKEDHQQHCSEVEHSDDFNYGYEVVDPPSGPC
jgi:hypothetical protein